MQAYPYERSIHFLRGVHSRAAVVLPAFYLFIGAMKLKHLNRLIIKDNKVVHEERLLKESHTDDGTSVMACLT